MAYTYAYINKNTLAYILEQKKVSKEYIVSKTKVKADKLDKWLDISDTLFPTIKQAKSIASCLHIPFAGLYMNSEHILIKSIPSIKNFRTLYGGVTLDDSAINIAMIDLLSEREFLMDANTENDISMTAFNMTLNVQNNPIVWANCIRDLFDIRLETQFRCSSSRKFYLYLREKIEASGILVHCFTDVPLEMARALALYDDNMPIIGINDEDRYPAKSFSIIHELVHIFKRESSLCNDIKSQRSEEVFCNAVAGELLVPQNALRNVMENRNIKKPYSKQNIQFLADKFSISKEVIVRRLHDLGDIDKDVYQAYIEDFQRDIEVQKEEIKIARLEGRYTASPQKSVSRDTIDRTSTAVCKVLLRGYGNDLYSKQDIARHLGISQKHVNKFLQEVSTWNN